MKPEKIITIIMEVVFSLLVTLSIYAAIVPKPAATTACISLNGTLIETVHNQWRWEEGTDSAICNVNGMAVKLISYDNGNTFLRLS